VKRDLKALGARVRTARLAKNVSLTDLAESCQISKGYLSSLETGGEVNPTIDVLFKIATALDLTLADLLEGPKTLSTEKIPGDLPEGLRELIDERRRAQDPVDESTVLWLARAEFRGQRPRTKEDFEFLLSSLQRAVPALKGKK
jgi:transcriptional regulator with XRE-family HTH domain